MRRLVWTVVVAVCALAGCRSDDGASDGTSDTIASQRGRARAVSEGGLDLRAMLPPVPEYEGQGRNLFAYGPERRTPPRPRATPSTPSARSVTTTTVMQRATTSPGARVNVKYAGFLEKTEPSGNKSKYAIFLDGNEILAGAEGETIANRFTVVEIGLESVTVSAEGSSTTERIPLQAN